MTDARTPDTQAEAQDLDTFLGAPPERPWRRRALWALGLAVLALLILLLSRCFAGEEEAGYATETARRGRLTVSVSATGNLQPTNQVEVGSEQSGLVTDVYVENNDRVTKGQPLARIDTARILETISQNRASLAAAQAQVANARATQALSRANLSRLEEVHRLSGGRVPSRLELDTGRAEYQQSVAQVRATEAQVSQARAVLSSSEVNLARATIYSPVTGVVLSRSVDPGQTVAASFQAPVLFQIAEDLSEMQLEVKVDEADVGQVRAGQRATFTVDAYPGRTFPARIERVDVGANASGSTTSASSASSSSTTTASTVIAYTAVLAVRNPELLLRPGMTATAEIITTEKNNALLVPNAALRYSPEREEAQQTKSGGVTSVLGPPRRRGSGSGNQREVTIGRGSRQTVYVLGEDGQPRAIQIVVGESDGAETEVVSGDLRAGVEVITGRLAAGQVQQKRPERQERGEAATGNVTAPAPAKASEPEKALGGGTDRPAAPSPTAPPVGDQPGDRGATPPRPAPGKAADDGG